MKKRESAWRMWASALGPKTGKNEKEADLIALLRTAILFSYIITNLFIISGVVRQWPRPSCASPGNSTPIVNH